jgi:hypothetical protein
VVVVEDDDEAAAADRGHLRASALSASGIHWSVRAAVTAS